MPTAQASKFAILTLVIALIGAGIALLFVFGASLGLWEPITGLQYNRQANNPIGYVVCTLSVVCIVYVMARKDRRGVAKPIIGLVLALLILAPMILNTVNPPQRFPPIHDISTDTTNPPAFLVLDDNRAGARNTLVYGGAEVAALKQVFSPISQRSNQRCPQMMPLPVL